MEILNTISVFPTTPILKVIEIIDRESYQFALVVDESNHLLGTVTDGDVRRGILQHVSLDSPISMIMNKNPITLRFDDHEAKILRTMRKKSIRHVPLVDENNTLKGVKFLDNMPGITEHENWVVLMVGGLGNRLRPLTESRPKPLLKIGEKPILEVTLEELIKQGFSKFFLTVNYKSEMIKDYFGSGEKWAVDIEYINENKKMGTAGSLSLLPSIPDLPIIVMNGDLVTKVNFGSMLEFHKKKKACATMAIKQYDVQVPYGVIEVSKSSYMTSINEKPTKNFFVNAGIYVLNPSTLNLIPKNTFFDMTSLFEKFLQKDQAAVFPIREYWIDIGKPEDYKKAFFDHTRKDSV